MYRVRKAKEMGRVRTERGAKKDRGGGETDRKNEKQRRGRN